MSKTRIDPTLIRAEACRRSFFAFVQEFWDTIVTEEPVYNWHIPFLCEELEKVAWNIIARNPKPYDLVINIPPGTTKTTIASIMFPAWAWIARLPQGFSEAAEQRWWKRLGPGVDSRPRGWDLRFIAGSHIDKISLENSSKSKDLIQSDKYLEFFPEIQIRRDKDAKSFFANVSGGSRFTTSAGSTPTGQHAHCLLVDDPVDPRKAMSDADRQTANDWMGNIMTRVVDKKLTPLILIMQRLHEEDPTSIVLKNHKNVRHIRLPADDGWEINPPELRDRYVDGLLDPIRITEDVLRDQEQILGPYGLAGQFGQDPRPREGGMFQKEWFEIVSAAPEGGIEVRGWDLAASKKKQGSVGERQAATAGVKMKIVNPRVNNEGQVIGGEIYILDDAHFYGGGREVRRRIRAVATQDGGDCIQDLPQDPGQAGKDQIQDYVALLHGFRVRYSTESGDKVVRADPFSAQCEAGNVKLVRGAWNDPWLDEMTLFPNGRKDRCDASVRAYARLLIEARRGSDSNFVGAPIGVAGKNYDAIGGAYL